MDLFTLASIISTGVDHVKMIQAPAASIDRAVEELKGVKAKMRDVLLRIEETQTPEHQPRDEQVGSRNLYFVILSHCAPVAAKGQQLARKYESQLQ